MPVGGAAAITVHVAGALVTTHVMHVQPHVQTLSLTVLDVPRNISKYADARKHMALTFSNAHTTRNVKNMSGTDHSVVNTKKHLGSCMLCRWVQSWGIKVL